MEGNLTSEKNDSVLRIDSNVLSDRNDTPLNNTSTEEEVMPN